MFTPVDLHSASGAKDVRQAADINKSEMEDIEKIKEWLADNCEINARQDDMHLAHFLRGCKHDLERTKEKIRRFYLMKTERPEWFAERSPFTPKIQELLEIGVFLPLHSKDNLNRRIFIIRTSAHDPKIHDLNDVFKVGKMILDLALEMYPDISVHGLVAIFDMSGVTWRHAVQLNPTLVKRSVDSWLIYPCKPKLLEFVEAPPHVNIGLNMFRIFMSAKMKSRLFVRNGTSTLNATLPKELGGEGESYAELAKFWKEKVEKNAEFFRHDEQFKTIIRDRNS